ncbi:DUF302 domain-containing protein [Persephonella sp.]
MLISFFKTIFLIGFIVFTFSCTAQISWKSGDPWDDDHLSSEENVVVSQNLEEEKKVSEEYYEEIPDIYERSVNMSYEEADLLLRSALEEANFKIIKIAHVTKGMKEQGRTDFWEDMHIYMICKLSDGYFILRHNPQLVGFCPYRVYTYRNKDGFLVIGMVKPSMALKFMGNPDLEAIKIMKEHDLQLKKIIDEITSN